MFGDTVSYLKLGMTNPLPIDLIRQFRANVETMYVVEELDPYLENQIKAAGIDCIGKDKIPAIDELNPNIVRKALLGEERKGVEGNPNLVVPRPPALCPGCPHRGFFYELGKRKDTVMVGDIGCYALGGSAPLGAKDLANCMGSAFSVGHGLSKAFALSGQDKTVVACMGDSTFFHTGVVSLEEVIYNDSHLICCILDNRITGMTGHQDNPGTGHTLMGEESIAASVEEIGRACGMKNIASFDPLNQEETHAVLKKAIESDEPWLLVSRSPCVLIMKQRKGNIRSIDSEKCKNCKSCLKTGCPAIECVGKGAKPTINAMSCNGCGLCNQVCKFGAISE